MTETPPQKAPRRFARELTSLAAAPLIIWIVGWGPPWSFTAFVVVVALLALYEFLVFGEKKGYVVRTVSVEIAVFAILLAIPAFFIFRGADLETALPGTAVSVLGTLYVGMLCGAVLRLRLDFPVGPKLVFFLFLVVWLGDAGAYYVGKRFGKTKLSPRVSPKKTVEGGIGGIMTSVLAAVVIHFTFFPEFPLVHALIAAIILSVTGVIGDLTESMWKRSADVKDSGTLIPGHGGFLDRSDSILFTAPILYGYWFLLVNDFRLTP
jgi:phosphatidate cytidylyltransferase